MTDKNKIDAVKSFLKYHDILFSIDDMCVFHIKTDDCHWGMKLHWKPDIRRYAIQLEVEGSYKWLYYRNYGDAISTIKTLLKGDCDEQ